MNFLKQIDSQVYAIVLVIAGALLRVKGQVVGEELLAAGLTMLKVTPASRQNPSTDKVSE